MSFSVGQGSGDGPLLGVVVWEESYGCGRWRAFKPDVSDYIETQYAATGSQCTQSSMIELGSVDAQLTGIVVDLKQMAQVAGQTVFSGVRRTIYPGDSPPANYVQWQSSGDLPNQWISYDVDVQCLLEKASNSHVPCVDLRSAPYSLPYFIDLIGLRQISVNTGFVRRIKRTHVTWCYKKTAPMTPAAIRISQSPIPLANPTSIPSTPAGFMYPLPARAGISSIHSGGLANGRIAHNSLFLLTPSNTPFVGRLLPSGCSSGGVMPLGNDFSQKTGTAFQTNRTHITTGAPKRMKAADDMIISVSNRDCRYSGDPLYKANLECVAKQPTREMYESSVSSCSASGRLAHEVDGIKSLDQNSHFLQPRPVFSEGLSHADSRSCERIGLHKRRFLSQPKIQLPLSHHCDLCKISCPGAASYADHLHGKMHNKKQATAESSLVATTAEVSSTALSTTTSSLELTPSSHVLRRTSLVFNIPSAISVVDSDASVCLQSVKVVLGGHSFIRRLRDYVAYHPFEFSDPFFCCWGGWKVPNLSQAFQNLPVKTFEGKIVYIEIGTNDLCLPGCNPKQLGADIGRLCSDILSRGAAFVVVGEPLPRFGPALAKLTFSFADAVQMLIRSLRSSTASMTNVKVWEHRRITPSLPPSGSYSVVPDGFSRDGVHLSQCAPSCLNCSCGMKRYFRSVRGAVLHAAGVVRTR